MPDFFMRTDEAEWLDDPSRQGEELEHNLAEIARINRWLGGEKALTSALNQMLIGYRSTAPLHIADLGCGSGDLPRAMVRWCRSRNIPVTVTAVDINPAIIAYARRCSDGYPEIQYQVMDICSAEFAAMQFDMVCCSLFLHHFSDAMIGDILQQSLRQSRIGVLVNDLERSALAHFLFKILTFTLPVTAVTRHDGAVSIRRGFRRSDLQRYLPQQGWGEVSIRWQWAFRWSMIIRKQVG